MKKLFTVLAVLLVATALFAGATVKAGGTFAFANINTATDDEVEESANIKAHGFGFDVGAQYDIADNLAVYAEFAMVFPKDATLSEDGGSVSLSDFVKDGDEDIVADPDVATYKINFFSISAGVVYKLDFNAVKLAVGGGLTLNRAAAPIHWVYEDLIGGDEDLEIDVKQTYLNIGLNALVDAKYMFTENIGAGVTLNPQLGLYNISKATFKSSVDPNASAQDTTLKGFKVSFAMPITVGVSYTF